MQILDIPHKNILLTLLTICWSVGVCQSTEFYECQVTNKY